MAATQTQAKVTKPAAEEDKGITLEGDLCEFNLGKSTPNRRYFTVHIPFGLARKVFKVEPYNPDKGKGEQRASVPSHVRKLVKAMEAGKFTPAPWSGGVREVHTKNLTIDEKKRHVTLVINPKSPLPLIDGGHRFASLEEIRKKALNGNNGAEDLARVDAIDISIQVYLNPAMIAADFQNLQENLRVSRSQLKMMGEQEKMKDPIKGPYIEVAQLSAFYMDKATDNDSFLSNDINFVGGGGGKVDYASITATNASDIATTMTGGAKIVTHKGFENFFVGDPHKQSGGKSREVKAAEFLVDCYQSLWRGIYKFDERVEVPHPASKTTIDSVPELISPGYMLKPNHLGGTKGGTGLLIMIGNMLAFKMLAIRKKTVIPASEIENIVAVAREIFLDEVQGGGSGTAKRAATGEFVREYFKDDIRVAESDEIDMNKIGAVDGVPTLLCDHILSRSTLNVSKNAEAQVSVPDKDNLSDPDQTMPGFEDEGPLGELEDEAASLVDDDDFVPPIPPKNKTSKKTPFAGTMG